MIDTSFACIVTSIRFSSGMSTVNGRKRLETTRSVRPVSVEKRPPRCYDDNAIARSRYLLRCVDDTGVVSMLEGRAESGRRDSERQSSIETLQRRSMAIVSLGALEKPCDVLSRYFLTPSRYELRIVRACARARAREKESEIDNI